MIFTWKKIILSSIIYSPYELVNGHGYMYSPRSRNWVAHQDGTDSWSGEGSAGTPVKEYCYHCLNNKAANEICGTGNSGNYDEWLDINGDPIPWNSQATYTEGEIITVKSYLSTNHGGHEDLFVCPDGSSSTQECLEANPLEYIDSNHGAPRDVKYPGRGYYSNEVEFEMRYKLPMGVTGDKVMLQWRYVTGNSCMSPGYCCHNDDDYFDLYQNVSSWKRANAALCTYPLDPTGATGTGKPELFWNCAEITILPSNGQPTTPSPVPPVIAPPTSATPSSSPVSGVGCCTIDFKACSPTVVGWCSESQENCEGPCDKWWLPNGAVEGCSARYESCSTDSDCCSPGVCMSDSNGYKSCQAPPDTPSPVTTPTTPSPVTTPTTPPPTTPQSGHLSCTENSMSSFSAFSSMEDLTYVVSTSPYTLTILAEGGAAGAGGSVVSEGQGYGLLTSAITLASLEASDPNRNDVMNKFYGYFNGWKKMCINSSPSPCQSPEYCTHAGGKAPCLPGWKHKGDLSEVEGTGSAPDGDEDAILGMIIAIKALEKALNLPSWHDELRQWTDESITQFLQDNTQLSTSGSHRLLKLGSCWGGWDSNGNNPSYPAPGAFRAMRDFHISYDGSRNYAMPTFGDNLDLKNKWDMLIDTTYKFYATTQCTDTGVVPNWALVKEVDSQSLDKLSGSFSGSGTPQYEFGAEASRTMWRVALDAVFYPEEASESSAGFLNPIHQKLNDGFDGLSDWADSTLQTCSYVTSIFGSWRYNGFMFGPVYSTLVVQATSMTTSEQQKRLNAACLRVANIPNSASYYAKSWQVISIMTLNGDTSKVGALLRGDTFQTNYPTPIFPPTPAPFTNAPPTPSPTPPTNANYCCSFDYKTCSASNYCNADQSQCETSCQGLWIDDSPKQCVALYSQCSASSDCCGPAACVDTGGWWQCQPGGSTSAPTPAPSNAPIVTPAPSKAPIVTPAPTISPTAPTTEGCYSNNYKHCLPGGSTYASCNNIWLPNGPQHNCVALWGDCTGNMSSCCAPAECFNDGNYASCIPTTDVTSTPTVAPTVFFSSSPSKSCRVKGESCERGSDCCKNKCNKKGKCRK